MIEKVLEIIRRDTGHSVTAETNLDSLDIDSLEMIDLLLSIERETGIVIPDNRVPHIHKVSDILGQAA